MGAYPTVGATAERYVAHRWTELVFGNELKSGKAWSMFFGRIALGFLFLWGGYQKIFAGNPEKIVGGFLTGSSVAASPFAGFFGAISGPATAWLVASGELLIGISLILGVLTRVGSVAGALQMLLFTAAMWPIADSAGANPLVDYRVIYGLMFLAFVFLRPGQFLGVDGILSRTKLLKVLPQLKWILG